MRCCPWLSVVLPALAIGALAVGPVHGQQPQGTVARLKDVQGNVLVSQGDAMVAGAAEQRLAPGTRVITTSGAKATISYDVGCDVTVPPDSRFTVRIGECAALAREVVALGPAEGAIGGGTGGAVAGGGTNTSTIMGVVGGAVIGIGAYETFRKKTVSPS